MPRNPTFSKEQVQKLLEKRNEDGTQWSRKQVAEHLGISPQHLSTKLNEWGLANTRHRPHQYDTSVFRPWPDAPKGAKETRYLDALSRWHQGGRPDPKLLRTARNWLLRMYESKTDITVIDGAYVEVPAGERSHIKMIMATLIGEESQEG